MLPEIEIDFKDNGVVAFERTKRQAINPIYVVGQELKVQTSQIITFKNGEERDWIRIKIKDASYTPSLGNIYTIIHLDLRTESGNLEEYTTEDDLKNNVI